MLSRLLVPNFYSTPTTMAYAVAFNGPPYSGGGGPGPQNSSHALSIPPSTTLRLGNATDFTIEMWVKNTGVIYNGTDYGNYFNPVISQSVIDEGNGNNTGWCISVQDTTISFGYVNGSAPVITHTPTTTTRNRYVHIALVRQSGVITMYVNGVSVGTYATAFNMNIALDIRPDTPILIGGHELVVSTTYYGNISNVRILNGVAAYTGNFTPPTKNLATSGTASVSCYASTTNVNTSFASSYCSLLTCQSSTIIDNALNATITNYGATVVAY